MVLSMIELFIVHRRKMKKDLLKKKADKKNLGSSAKLPKQG
jgi:hypothetical protein